MAKAKRHELGRIAAGTQQVKGKGCAGLIAAATEELSSAERSDLAKAEVSAVRVEGKEGQAIYSLSAAAEYATPMQHEGGDWKVAGINRGS